MLTSLLARFNYPDRSALGPILTINSFFGVWYPGRTIKSTIRCYWMLTYNMTYFTSILANLVVNYDLNIFIIFIQFSSFLLGIQRTIVILMQHKRWEKLVQQIFQIEIESSAEKGSKHGEIVSKYKNYCQFFTVAYWGPLNLMLSLFILVFWIQFVIIPEIMNTEKLEPLKCIFYALLPFDQNSRGGRIISVFLQSMFAIHCSIFILTWDTLMMTCMIFFASQLKALRVRCLHALDSPNEEVQWRNIVNCHKHHVAIMNCINLFNSLIEPVTFAHILQTSIVCGICVVQLVLLRGTTAETIRTLDLLIGVNFQLLVYYAVANGVIVQSENLAYGVFESRWVGTSVRVRRAVLALIGGLQKRVAFTAGPFSEMSLATLVSIFRGVYSFYTLISQMN